MCELLPSPAILPVCPPGCPLFDRPQRGRKKPHQPALAHCVHVAGLYAPPLTAPRREWPGKQVQPKKEERE